MSKPSTVPIWDSNGTNASSPTAAHQTDGWPRGTSSPLVSTVLNYWMNLVYLWIVWLNGLWGADGSLSLDSNGSLTTVGTTFSITDANNVGMLKHSRQLALLVPVVANHCVLAAGSISADTNPGAVLAASTDAYFPLDGLDLTCRVVSVIVTLGATPANSVDYSIGIPNTTAGSRTWVPVGSASGVATTLTIDVNPAATIGTSFYAGRNMYLRVQTGGATGVTVKAVAVNYNQL